MLVIIILVALFERGLDSGIAAQHLLGKLRSAETAISWRQAPALFLLGIGAGLFGGMLGLGGGVLKVAGMLLLFNLDIFFARAVSLTTMFITTASAAWPYAKRGFPIRQIIRPMLPPALVGVVGGLLLGNQLRGATLTHLFGFFVLFLGLYTLAMVFDDPKEHVLRRNFSNGRLHKYHGRLSGSIGALHGFICGLLGISGGVISVPMQQLLLNTPVRHAIANTLVVSAVCSGLGSITVIAIGTGRGVFSLEHILFAVMAIGGGAVLGAQIGVHMGLKSDTGVLRFLFVVISFGAGLSLLL
ncbi:MAG: sulfite exporter TauE/SafE family protein [Deltaproteobacteria bacterium]|nr:sulfite exporter TauE/SafE family protein [Deltaproteobacteria bacterium]